MPVFVELVSPERLVLSRPIDMVVIPAYEGDIGVLPGHAPMIVLLRGGMVSLYEGGQVRERVFVSGGFAEIVPDRCTVLADEASPPEQVSREEGERRLRAAEEAYGKLGAQETEAQLLEMDRMQSARAMIEAGGAH